MANYPMTPKGAEALKTELHYLKGEKRPQISKAIEEARAHGDLKENAEYHAAKDQQGLVEARIREIEGKLSSAQVIDLSLVPHDGRVIFGVKVTLLDIEADEEVSYQLVGEDEADVKSGMISVTSPLSRALIGKEEGDEVEFQAPGGKKSFEILKVSYDI